MLTRFVWSDNPDNGKWTMPAGGMEAGESPDQTAHRELAEEKGLTTILGTVLGVFSRWYTAQESARDESGHVVGIVYEATDVHGRLRAEFDAGSTDDARWFAVEDVRGLRHVELVDFVLVTADCHKASSTSPSPCSRRSTGIRREG